MRPELKPIMRRACAFLIAFAVPVAAAHAALIKFDSPLGPNTIARDTTQGLDWLNLRLTRNLSIGEVLAETVPGGRFKGFRYSGYADFRTLYGPFLTCTYSAGHSDFLRISVSSRKGFGRPEH
jgi:hypothetical protein